MSVKSGPAWKRHAISLPNLLTYARIAAIPVIVGLVVGVASGPEWLETGIFVVSVLAGVRFFAVEAVEELVSEREVGIELLMTVAAVVAASLGLWGEAASLAFLYSISEALEAFTEGKTRNAIRAPDLEGLEKVVEEQYKVIDDREKAARTASARLEADLVRRFMELKEHG